MIKIRRAKPSDAKCIVEMMSSGLKRGMWKYTGTDKIRKDRVEKTKANYLSGLVRGFIALDTQKDIVVGSCTYHFKKRGRLRHKIEVGWGMHPDYEGQGIATKLLTAALADAKKRKFIKAEAEIAVPNKGSLRLAQKCGFLVEGRKKKGLLLDTGKYVDLWVVGKIL